MFYLGNFGDTIVPDVEYDYILLSGVMFSIGNLILLGSTTNNNATRVQSLVFPYRLAEQDCHKLLHSEHDSWKERGAPKALLGNIRISHIQMPSREPFDLRKFLHSMSGA